MLEIEASFSMKALEKLTLTEMVVWINSALLLPCKIRTIFPQTLSLFEFLIDFN